MTRAVARAVARGVTVTRRTRSGLALAVALFLLTGCGLPLGGGVRSAGQVPEAEQGPAPISVLPPGPQPGASPQDILRGFLTAQSSPRERHGVARTFLLPAEQAAWNDEAGVVVYEPGSLSLDASGSETEATVRLHFAAVGSVAADGAAATQPSSLTTQLYRLRKDAVGAWRLAEVPAGLTLSPGDRDRSYAPASVMFVSATTPMSRAPHLVPDRVLLSVDGDRARRLVEHVLQGPSAGLGASGATAAPPGTRLVSVGTNAAGEVLVQLSGQPLALPPDRRRDLTAQLVWTLRLGLPDFSRLRLESDGQPLDLDGESGPYPRTAFAGYDPEGAALSSAPTLALVSGRVEVIGDEDVSARFVPAGQPVTDATDAVADVRTGALAVLTGPPGARTLLTGTTTGALARLASGAALASPTWGDGSLGVWLLRTGADPA
ncbi:MAG: Lipoprotein LpqB, beta-propeller domain-like protein, partial [Frankiales bacterium]|nr:Lipoprotein LpqB, beta-propeller domain-like protein [Frankiales bacterium]